MLPAEVLPQRSRFIKTFSGETLKFSTAASMIRLLAWWKKIKSISSSVKLACETTSPTISGIKRTAHLKTDRPSIFKKAAPCSTAPTVAGIREPPQGTSSVSPNSPSEAKRYERIPDASSGFELGSRSIIAAPAPSPNKGNVFLSLGSTTIVIISAPITSVLRLQPDLMN